MESSIGRQTGDNVAEVTGSESNISTMHPLLSWRSVVAGLLISLLCLVGLVGLGLGFGGLGLEDGTSARSAGIFSGVWFLVSALVSLFIGSYYAARISKFQMGRVGSAQGLVIASLFLGFFLYQIVSAIGLIGSTTGNIVGGGISSIASGVQRVAQNSQLTSSVNTIAEDALGDLNLRSDPGTVASGLGARLIRGDVESAKNYLGREAGITPAEADVRINQLQALVNKYIEEAKNATANVMQSTGWSLFLLVVLGSLAAIGGGALGSVANYRRPLSRDQYVLRQQRA